MSHMGSISVIRSARTGPTIDITPDLVRHSRRQFQINVRAAHDCAYPECDSIVVDGQSLSKSTEVLTKRVTQTVAF
ncbi:hypothetical protein Y029_442 [Burkholderia pseudomallei MSHR303]|nr:hypothetical protein BDL_2119 [Burkholderia pseudomallei MSHR305]AHK66728.1 hypothetical protein BBX_511 [Burkholderia pseudomallei MSHR520]AIP80937.1 hypothetical protein JE55_1510 [Burkholderia pseudomallei]KGV64556.1 hypothetical protein X900_5821 [Burkholderia pseudomallei BDU 2]KGW35666.1 hypothetical protein Y045_5461 [Burkholderia pseudomallei MSHR2451]KGW53986.1 hypothetical protein Y029_442 [Burkholderia pseudomallei MSHR303]